MGSDEKIDVNYVGVGGEAAEVLEGLTKFYGVFVLMDEGVWEGLEEKIREGCRFVGDHDGPVYVFDIDLARLADVEGKVNEKIVWRENVWNEDEGLRAIRKKFDEVFFLRWNVIVEAWEASEFERCKEMATKFKEDYNDSVASVWEQRCEAEIIIQRERMIESREEDAQSKKEETWFGDFLQ